VLTAHRDGQPAVDSLLSEHLSTNTIRPELWPCGRGEEETSPLRQDAACRFGGLRGAGYAWCGRPCQGHSNGEFNFFGASRPSYPEIVACVAAQTAL